MSPPYREIGWNAFQTPSGLENLPPSLERIHIVDSYITALPSDFANLTNVTYLYVLVASASLSVASVEKLMDYVLLYNRDLKVNYITDLSKSTFPPNLKTLYVIRNIVSFN